jgi:hypothetical protein
MPLTLADVEEALQHLRAVPESERGAGWSAYLDSLLDQRVLLAGTESQLRETRVVTFSETR